LRIIIVGLGGITQSLRGGDTRRLAGVDPWHALTVRHPSGDGDASDERERCGCSVHVFLAIPAADRRTKTDNCKWVKKGNGETAEGPRKDARRYVGLTLDVAIGAALGGPE
jgi:hypothetical protein